MESNVFCHSVTRFNIEPPDFFTTDKVTAFLLFHPESLILEIEVIFLGASFTSATSFKVIVQVSPSFAKTTFFIL
jgi:hypothetical protein